MVTRNQIAVAVKEVMASRNIHLTTAEAALCVSTVFQGVKNGLINDGEVRIDAFGTFKRKDVPDRRCRNPRTGETIVAPAHKAAVFKSAKMLSEAINGK